jgi:DNA-binding response OmpR family regulator
LTAFSDDETIKRAVQTDPAGYLVKPYNPEELKSMIQLGIYKSNTFRSDVAHEKQYSHIGHGYYFDRTTMELYYKEIPIKLSKKEKALIDILLKAKGDIVSLEKLELLIWYNKPVSSSSLRTLIYRTRAKLNNKVIVTVPYFGCKIDIPQE